MSPDKRIILNAIATYGRSLYSIACGLLISRWALMVLGQRDYGLVGVIGGLTFFIAFFNNWLSSAIGRYYAVAVGRASVADFHEDGIGECRKWFNTAVSIHTIVPIILVAVGYPLGVKLIRSWLVIPVERVDDCVWMFRFVCISCFVNMVNVPFSAMYIAKQYIAELTIYSIASTTATVIFLYGLLLFPGDCLLTYSFGICIITIIPKVIICIRALCVFEECLIDLRLMWNYALIKKVGAFAGWQIFGALGWLLQGQGVALVVNKFFGPRVNAAMSIANSVNGHVSMLAGALQGAVAPAIMNSFGANDSIRMKMLAHRANKFCFISSIMLFLPFLLEVEEVVILWLKAPPPYTCGLCMVMMVAFVANNASSGSMSAVLASGKIALYQVVLGGIMISALPMTALAAYYNASIYTIGGIVAFVCVLHSLGRVVFAKLIIGMPIRQWLFKIIVPTICIAIVAACVGVLPVVNLEPSLFRVCITTGLVELCYLPMVWRFLLDNEEKQYIKSKFLKRFERVK